MAAKVEVKADLSEELYAELAEYAEKNGIPIAGAIAKCVAECLRKRLDAYDLGDGSEQQGGLA